jgi:DNA-binding response OmpR family regulator
VIMEIIKMKPTKREYSQFLIIDDDPGIAKFLVTYLRQRGHTCYALTDGFQTAAWLSENDCEVAIVDLKMPKVDGISLISFMRELNPTLPIVVFTGVGYDEEQMHAALHAGANGYVSKNLPIEQLYCVLARILATCQQRKRSVAFNGQETALAGAA